ncbi:MAG: amino acid transporter substrate-binding protein [Rubritepida sp.]|nr:amino acid transporter substrate-binding protein [Rubritepida sp.]
MRMRGFAFTLGLLCGVVAGSGPVLAQGNIASLTLDSVRSRGVLSCGVSTGVAGFALPNQRGEWEGLDADLCRGLAAAIFNDPTKVRFVPLSASARFTAVTTGEIDVLFRNSTQTMSRATTLGLRDGATYFYDGMSFLVRADSRIERALQLGGSTICLLQGTTNEVVTAEYFRAHQLAWTPLVFERLDQVMGALIAGRCDSFANDASSLSGARSALPIPADWTVLPERFSKEPYSAFVRRGDDNWFDIVRWYTTALIQAEEHGITRENVTDLRRTTTNAEIRRLLGVTPELGQYIKLDPAWAFNAIRSVGNYGEIYDRTIGPNSRVGLARGPNNLWTNGGLIYAIPMR